MCGFRLIFYKFKDLIYKYKVNLFIIKYNNKQAYEATNDNVIYICKPFVILF